MAELSASARATKAPSALRTYDQDIAAIRASISGTRLELLAREVLPALGVGMVAILLSDLTLVLLYLLYTVAQILMFGFIFTRGEATSRQEYLFSLLVCALSSVSYIVMAMYLWSTGVLVAQFAACFLVLGFAIYLLTRNGTLLIMLLIDGLPIAVGTLFFAWFLSDSLSGQVHPSVPMAMTLLIVTYYLISLYQVSVTRQQLQRARQQALAAERMAAVGSLSGGVAHDFNNILTAVLGHLDLYAHLSSQGEKDGCVSSAHQAAERAARLTSQLLLFARKGRLAPQPTDLTALLRGFIPRGLQQLPTGVQMDSTLPQNLPEVLVDPVQLEAVLVQLLLNARDSMPDGGQIMLSARPHLAERAREMHGDTVLLPGAYCEIVLSDSGVGIAPEMIGRVFEPFFTSRPKGKASGLGLSMASGFADQSGGALWISSTPGQGTAVSLFLPVAGPLVH